MQPGDWKKQKHEREILRLVAKREYALKVWCEERIQAIERLEVMQDLGFKSFDPRYEREYYVITDLAQIIWFWNERRETFVIPIR